MILPPEKIFLESSRKPIYLIAFTEYEKFIESQSYSQGWFIGFYTLPHEEFCKYAIVVLNSSGDKVTLIHDGSSSFEYSVIIFTAFYKNANVLDLSSFATFLDRDLFRGKLSKAKYAYKKELFKVEKRLSDLKRDYWNAIHH